MENYREKLRGQCVLMGICCMALGGVMLTSHFLELEPVTGDSHWSDAWHGFLMGATAALLLLLVFGLARNLCALYSEKAMKKLYVKEHDERDAQIYLHARSLAMQVFLLGGLVAMVVAGYFSVTVSLTIFGCVIICTLIALGGKLYYSQKF